MGSRYVVSFLCLGLAGCGGAARSGVPDRPADLGSSAPVRSADPGANAFAGPATPAAEGPLRYVQVAVGSTHGCALTDGGRVHCWGRTGATLDDPSLDLHAPSQVSELSDVIEIAAHQTSTCALRKDGVVLCAFAPSDALTAAFLDKRARAAFTPVEGLEGAKGIALAREAVCAVLRDGGVACAGVDRFGGRGLGDASVSGGEPPPARIPGLAGIRKIVAGRDGLYGGFCALGEGQASCWGLGNPARFPAGSLRDVTTDVLYTPSAAKVKGFATPTALPGASDVDDLSWWDEGLCVRRAGGDFACRGAAATKRVGPEMTGGRVYVGSRARCAVRADGTTTCWETPRTPKGLPWSTIAAVQAEPGVTSVSVGSAHACALRKNGDVACWGDARHGELGSGALYTRSQPARVALPPVAQVTAADARTCARLTDGSVRCWGRHGPALTAKQAASCERVTAQDDEPRCPSPVEMQPAAAAVRMAGSGPLCLKPSESAPWKCAPYYRPTRLEPVTGVRGTFATITASNHMMFGLADGRAYASNLFGGADVNGAVLPAFGERTWTKGISLAALSSDGACGITLDARVVCACDDGRFNRSALCTRKADLYELPSLRGATQVVHTPNGDVCALDGAGRPRCSRDVLVPKEVDLGIHVAPPVQLAEAAPMTDVSTLVATSMFSRGGTNQGDVHASYGGGACALTRAGAVFCWGMAGAGQVGDPSRPPAVAVPRRVEGLPPVVEVALGAEHACARTDAGELWCWGSDIEGQLGLGTPGVVTTPTKLAPPATRPRASPTK